MTTSMKIPLNTEREAGTSVRIHLRSKDGIQTRCKA